MICAVVGQSARLYDAGLAALADAIRTNYNVPVSWAAPFHVLIPYATAMWWLASCTACFMTGRRADQVLPASAEAFGDLRSGLGKDGGGQVEQQRAVQGRGQLGGQDVQVGGAEAHLPEQEPDVFPRHGRLRSGWYPLPAVQCGACDIAVPDQEVDPGPAVGDQPVRFDLKYGMPGLTHDQLMANIELYGRQVIPRVCELLS